MPKLSMAPGVTSQTVNVFIQDSSVTTTVAGRTGLVFNTAGLTCYYVRTRGTSTAVTLATLASASAAWATGGFIEIDATNQPGMYRLDIPDAALAASARFVTIYLRGASNMVPCILEIDLQADANLTHIAASAVATGTAQLGVNVVNWGGTAVASANVRANVVQVAGQTASAAGAVTFPGTIASTTNITAATGVVLSGVTHTGAVIPTVTTVTNAVTAGTVSDKTGYSLLATTGLGNQTANITGNLSGSVDSVTGAVGSVTGNVGGNVVGSVASVTAAVTLPTIPTNWITAAGIAASALNGKGDWNVGKTGYSLAAAGVDAITVETGLNLRQAMSIVAASAAGTLSGAATTTITIDGAGVSTDRIVATVDASGNRTAVTLSPPA